MDNEKPVRGNQKIAVGGVNVHIIPKNGTGVELGINQKRGLQGKAQDAAFAVIAQTAKEKFGDRVKVEHGQGWEGAHGVRIQYTAKDKATDQDLPAVTMDDVKTMLNELNDQYPRRAALHKAARQLSGQKGRG